MGIPNAGQDPVKSSVRRRPPVGTRRRVNTAAPVAMPHNAVARHKEDAAHAGAIRDIANFVLGGHHDSGVYDFIVGALLPDFIPAPLIGETVPDFKSYYTLQKHKETGEGDFDDVRRAAANTGSDDLYQRPSALEFLAHTAANVRAPDGQTLGPIELGNVQEGVVSAASVGPLIYAGRKAGVTAGSAAAAASAAYTASKVASTLKSADGSGEPANEGDSDTGTGEGDDRRLVSQNPGHGGAPDPCDAIREAVSSGQISLEEARRTHPECF